MKSTWRHRVGIVLGAITWGLAMAMRDELSNVDERSWIAGAGSAGVFLAISISHRRRRADVLAAGDGPRTESIWWRRVGVVLAVIGFAYTMARYEAVPRGVARALMGGVAGVLLAISISHGHRELSRL
jgi:hypothetical protein